MLVVVKVKVDVDPEAWMRNYGVDRSEVREDVERYVQDMAREQIRSVGCTPDR